MHWFAYSCLYIDYVRQRMDPVLMDGLENKGFVSFGIAEVGFAYAMSKAALSSVDDVQAQRVWVPDNDPGSARALAAFEIAPIPLSIADVLGGLQTGLINSVAVPPVGAIILQWHTQLEHVLDLPLLYIYGLLTVNKRQFERLSVEDQEVVRRVMGEQVAQVNARSRRDHLSNLLFQDPRARLLRSRSPRFLCRLPTCWVACRRD